MSSIDDALRLLQMAAKIYAIEKLEVVYYREYCLFYNEYMEMAKEKTDGLKIRTVHPDGRVDTY